MNLVGVVSKGVLSFKSERFSVNHEKGRFKVNRRVKTSLILIFVASVLCFLSQDRADLGPPAELLYQPQELAVVYRDPDGLGPITHQEPRLEGSLVIDFVDGFTPDDLRAFRAETGLNALYHSIHSLDSALTVADVPDREIGHWIARLESDPRVQAVSPNFVYSAYDVGNQGADLSSFPDDPGYKYQWHMDQIRAEEAWRWTAGEGVVVAIIDTGVTHQDSDDGRFHVVEDLRDAKFVEGYDFINRKVDASDDHCHGTHVAGTVAQATNNGKGVTGVAFNSTIMPVKVLSGRGSGSNAGVAEGIRFAADNGAKVMNLSLGGPSNSKVLDEAVKYATEKGTLVVCAAGNSNRPRPGYPAGCEGAISVSALDFEENLTFYSNYGPSISIAAPGGDTRADKNGDGMPDGVYQNTIAVQNPGKSDYYNFQGTSMASPHAAGVFVLGASLGVTKRSALEELVFSTTRPVPENSKEGYGAGILDAGNVAKVAGFEYGCKKLLLGFAVAFLTIAVYLRRRRILAILFTVPGVLFGACGIAWFVPALGLNNAPLNPLLVNGFPAWDIFFLGVDQHGSFLTHSALAPIAFCGLVTVLRFLRPLAAGFAAGVAGHLAFVATHDVLTMGWLPEDMQTLWLGCNALFCLALSVACGARD